MNQVLSGCVESVEDHGTIIDIGVSGTKAFLPEDATKSKQHKSEGKKYPQNDLNFALQLQNVLS